MKSLYGPSAVLIILCLAAGIGVAQPYVEDSIDVGGAWVGGMVYNSREDAVYGNCQYTNGIFFAIDCGSNEVVANWSIPWPREAAYNSTDNKVYVSFQAGGEDSVMVIDGHTHHRLGAIAIADARMPLWDSVSDRVYVACGEENRVSVIDCRTDSVIAHIPVGAGPLGMDLNMQRRKLYVQNYDANTISVINTVTNLVIRSVPVGEYLTAACYSEAADKYYTAGGPGIVVIDGSGDSVSGTIPLPTGASVWSMLSLPGQRLVLAGAEDGASLSAVCAIDVDGDTILTELHILRGPRALCASALTRLVYCANFDGYVTVLDERAGRALDTLRVGYSPFQFAYSPTNRRLYVSHLGNRRVYVIRDSSAGIAEQAAPPSRENTPATTVVRRSIVLAGAEPVALVDVTGREATKLRPGLNDLSALVPGVYMVVGRGGPSTKVVLAGLD